MDRVTELIVKLMTPYIDKREGRNRDRHQEALKALSETGSPSIPMLMEALKAPDAKLRASAAYALGEVKEPQAVLALIVALQDKYAHVRREAAKALREVPDPQAVPALIVALKDKDNYVRIHTAVALWKIKDTRSVPALAEALQDKVVAVSITTAQALNEIASSDPVPALRDALPTLRRIRKNSPLYQETLDKIEAATAGMKDLPLPAAAPLPDATSLPRPSVAPVTAPDDLPIPSAPEDVADLQSKPNDAVARSRRGLMSQWFD